MEDVSKNLPPEDESPLSLDEILADAELSALLSEPKVPAFEDPNKIYDDGKPVAYNNFANDYGAPKTDDREKKNDRVIVGLMITASVLCLGIIGVLSYWLSVLL